MRRKRIRATLFGPRGSGKTTQAQLLADYFAIPSISSGELCRREMAEGSSLGQLVTPYVERGMLAPDGLVDAIMMRQLKSIPLDKGFVLDGYPRNVEQAEALDRALDLNLAIHLKLSDDQAVRRLPGRLQCIGCFAVFHEQETPLLSIEVCPVCESALTCRADDAEESVRIRLAEYHFMTEPLASYYRRKGVLLSVNGDQSIASLFEELTKKMKKLGFV